MVQRYMLDEGTCEGTCFHYISSSYTQTFPGIKRVYLGVVPWYPNWIAFMINRSIKKTWFLCLDGLQEMHKIKL